MLLQFADSRFKTQHDITIGVEYGTKTITLKDHEVKLQIWDTVILPVITPIYLGWIRNIQVDYENIL